MATAFDFELPVYDNGRWTSRGRIYTIGTGPNNEPTFENVDGFNPADIVVTSPNYETVKSAWASLAQQVDSKATPTWAAHVAASPSPKFGQNGLPL